MQLPTTFFETMEPFDFDPFGFFDFFTIMFTIVAAIVVMVFIAVFVIICRSGAKTISTFQVQAPSYAIPESHKDRTRTDGSEYKTVRVPEKCPSCGANLSHETIDWVGPLEAQCGYCGGTVRARFESI